MSRIAEDGFVYMPVFGEHMLESSLLKKIGLNSATVFTGFCGYHDKTLFQPIEDVPFSGTTEQVFLHIYRAFAFEYHKKRHAFEMQRLLGTANLFGIGFDLATKDFADEKKLFDKALLANDYAVLTSFIWEFPGAANFAATGQEVPTAGFDQLPIQNILDESAPMRHLYFSVFPEGELTIAIFAWLSKFDTLFTDISVRLSSLSADERKNFVNNTIIRSTENIAIRPSSWEKLDPVRQHAFQSMFVDLAPTDDTYASRLLPAVVDFFSL